MSADFSIKTGNPKDDTYRDRFVEEYKQLKNRFNKLCTIINRYDAGILDFELDCPIGLLKNQQIIMQNYILVLEERAEYENIVLM